MSRRAVGAVDLDEFYRKALIDGRARHAVVRGLLPYGLEVETRALEHPPLPWDARLARWFDEHLPAEVPRRSYARPSRRQSASPDIPRPGRLIPTEHTPRHTFDVVLDTSGSMPPRLLGKALGAIASYALAHDVPAARVVYCDTAPYDAGFLPVEALAQRARVRGRGGTALQRAINLLIQASDFPPDAPILVITDGECEPLRVPRREHAYSCPAARACRSPGTARCSKCADTAAACEAPPSHATLGAAPGTEPGTAPSGRARRQNYGRVTCTRLRRRRRCWRSR